jgi:predicted dehydrogenase
MADLRFAVFGAGFWAPYQLAGWRETGGVNCVAICDTVISKAGNLARRFDVPSVYCDAEKLLDSEQLHFVDIITDASSHSTLVRMAAERGVPVICQKPMATTLAEAGQMVTLCQEKRVPFYIHENWRWQKQIRQFKEVIDSGEIGSPFRAHVFLVSGYPVFSNEPRLKDLENYVLTDMGVHLLDVCRFLFGEAGDVFCHTHRVQDGIRGEDAATVMMRMGRRTTVTCSMGFPGHFLEHDVFTQTLILVEGDAGSAKLDRDYWIRVTTSSGTRARRYAPIWLPWMHPQYLASHASIVPCNTNLLRALRGEGDAETVASDNLKTMGLTFAAYESARSGVAIQLIDSGKRDLARM